MLVFDTTLLKHRPPGQSPPTDHERACAERVKSNRGKWLRRSDYGKLGVILRQFFSGWLLSAKVLENQAD